MTLKNRVKKCDTQKSRQQRVTLFEASKFVSYKNSIQKCDTQKSHTNKIQQDGSQQRAHSLVFIV